jgi:hypothetical protein
LPTFFAAVPGAAHVVGCHPEDCRWSRHIRGNVLQRVTVDDFDSALSDDALAAIDAFDRGSRRSQPGRRRLPQAGLTIAA